MKKKAVTPKKDSVNKEKKQIKEQIKILCQLFLIFLKIGAFTFGGGYAMISLIQKEITEKKKWVDNKEMLDIIAIAESTPGVIALNSATYVGAKVGGFFGALVASVAVMLPSIIIIILLSNVINQFETNKYVKWAFLGVRSAVVALILNALYSLSKGVKRSIFSLVVFTIALLLALLSSFEIIPLNIIYIIAAAAIAGIIYGYFYRKKQNNSANKQAEGNNEKAEGNNEKDESNNKQAEGNNEQTEGNNKKDEGNNKKVESNNKKDESNNKQIDVNDEDIKGNKQTIEGSNNSVSNNKNCNNNCQKSENNSENNNYVGFDGDGDNLDFKTKMPKNCDNNETINYKSIDSLDNENIKSNIYASQNKTKKNKSKSEYQNHIVKASDIDTNDGEDK